MTSEIIIFLVLTNERTFRILGFDRLFESCDVCECAQIEDDSITFVGNRSYLHEHPNGRFYNEQIDGDVRPGRAGRTVLLVEQHFHLFDVTVLECIAYLRLRVRRREIAEHEITCRTSVHQIRPQVAREFGETIVGINNRVIKNLRIG